MPECQSVIKSILDFEKAMDETECILENSTMEFDKDTQQGMMKYVFLHDLKSDIGMSVNLVIHISLSEKDVGQKPNGEWDSIDVIPFGITEHNEEIVQYIKNIKRKLKNIILDKWNGVHASEVSATPVVEPPAPSPTPSIIKTEKALSNNRLFLMSLIHKSKDPINIFATTLAKKNIQGFAIATIYAHIRKLRDLGYVDMDTVRNRVFLTEKGIRAIKHMPA